MSCLRLVAALSALSAPGAFACSEEEAKKQTATHPEVSAFCARNKHGCDFKARPPSPLNADEKKDATLAWIVTASQIHSFDEQGRPRFMPEGAIFTRVSKGCAVTQVMTPWPKAPPSKSQRSAASEEPAQRP